MHYPKGLTKNLYIVYDSNSSIMAFNAIIIKFQGGNNECPK